MVFVREVILKTFAVLILIKSVSFASDDNDFSYLKETILVTPIKQGYSFDEKSKKTILVPGEIERVFEKYINKCPYYFNRGITEVSLEVKDRMYFGPVFYFRGENDIDVYLLNECFVRNNVEDSLNYTVVAQNRKTKKTTKVPMGLVEDYHQVFSECHWEDLFGDRRYFLVFYSEYRNGSGLYKSHSYYLIANDLSIKKVFELYDEIENGPNYTYERIVEKKKGSLLVEEKQVNVESDENKPFVETREIKIEY